MANSLGTGSFGVPSNSRVVNAVPWVNSTTVTDFDPPGEVPETMVPLDPTAAGPGFPPVTVSPSAAVAPWSAFVEGCQHRPA